MCEAIKVVQHHLRCRIPLKLYHNAHAVAIGLIAQVADTLNLFGPHQFGDALDQGVLVDLIRDFMDHDRIAVFADFLDRGLGPQRNATTPSFERLPDAGTTKDDAAGGEVRPGDNPHQFVKREVWIGNQRQRGIDHLTRIVGWNVGRHAHGNATAAVDEQIGECGGQHARLFVLLVVVRLKINSVFVNVGQHMHRGARQTTFRVAHSGRGITVDGAEVALPVNQGHAQAERLRHADQGIVDR